MSTLLRFHENRDMHEVERSSESRIEALRRALVDTQRELLQERALSESLRRDVILMEGVVTELANEIEDLRRLVGV